MTASEFPGNCESGFVGTVLDDIEIAFTDRCSGDLREHGQGRREIIPAVIKAGTYEKAGFFEVIELDPLDHGDALEADCPILGELIGQALGDLEFHGIFTVGGNVGYFTDEIGDIHPRAIVAKVVLENVFSFE